MLVVNGKNIVSINHLAKGIQYVAHLGVVVWQAIRSCFGYGAWINDAPYLNDEGWNNG